MSAVPLGASVAAMIGRDLRAMQRELDAYTDERDLWVTPPGMANSAGTLALHISGSLRHFVGARLGGDGYVRDRAAEFARRDVPRAELHAALEAARRVVETVLPALDEAALARDFPDTIANVRVQVSDLLVHFTTHVAYHLGQMDYHRRTVTGSAVSVSPVSPAELRSARGA